MLILFLVLSQLQFGKNKIQYRDFQWNVKETAHFKIYYYKGEENLIPFASQVAEDAYKELSKDLNYEFTDKAPIIIYASHNNFEQTNVVDEIVEEWVGGFTEMFKDRVVVPFDGSYESFRHVLNHEITHTFQYRILYGKGLDRFRSIYRLNVPLWWMEGMAEFESQGWNSEADMFMKDAVVNDYYLPIDKLSELSGGYLVYKEGQSIMKFIADKYGRQKIGEITHKIKLTKDLRKAIQNVLGIDYKQLSKDWEYSVRKEYWPILKDRVRFEDIATKLIDHKEIKNSYNYAPAISPKGDRIIYYTDINDNISIRMISALDGSLLAKIASAGKSKKFESLHLLRGKISWSPDESEIAFVSKSEGKDVINIYSMKKRKVTKRICPNIDGINSPSFSPDGKKIAFSGFKNGASDIYVYDISMDETRKITDDIYSDYEPIWYNNGILFVSDRPVDTTWDYNFYALWYSNNDVLFPLTNKMGLIYSPVFNGDSLVYFISTYDGSGDIYKLSLISKSITHLTKTLGGVYSISISNDGERLATDVFNNGGWDIYLLKHPDKLKGDTLFQKREFAQRFTPVQIKNYNGGQKAPLEFSIDALGSFFYYDSYYGAYGDMEIALSDILGNHRIYLSLNGSSSQTYPDFYIEYLYLKHRIDYGGYAFKSTYGVISNDTLYIMPILGGALTSRIPIDKFNRFEMGALGLNITQDVYYPIENQYYYLSTRYLYGLLFELSYIRDTSIWGALAPISGTRGKISLMSSAELTPDMISFKNISLDWRNYIRITSDISAAAHIYLSLSSGRDANMFGIDAVGGPGSVRGYPYYWKQGIYAGHMNFEFRFPFIKRISLGFPPINIRDIRGRLFLDIGDAFSSSLLQYNPIQRVNGEWHLNGPIMGIGFETGWNLGFAYFNLDIARQIDLYKLQPNIYFNYWIGFPF